MKQSKSTLGRSSRRQPAQTPFLAVYAGEQANTHKLNPSDKTKLLAQSVGSNHVSFELISLDCGNTIGVTRSIRTEETGIVEQAIVFSTSSDFQRWLDADEFQEKAPELFFSVRRTFEAMLTIKI